jgi:hypothetical protein
LKAERCSRIKELERRTQKSPPFNLLKLLQNNQVMHFSWRSARKVAQGASQLSGVDRQLVIGTTTTMELRP